MIQVAYTNSNCSDLWDIFQKQTLKHSKMPLYMISDKSPNNLGLSDLYLYNNTLPYYKVWVDALTIFNSDYFIYLQEDFLLYSDVNQTKIDEYTQILKDNTEYSFVRLIKSGNLNKTKISDTLYEIESTNQQIFSMQSTIWRTKDYIKLMELVKEDKWLENDKYKQVMIEHNIKGLYHYDDEVKRGENHYDTNVYPYIATALVKGKWNLREYPSELGDILTKNNININIRGTI